EWILLSDLISVRDFSNYKFYEMDIKIKIPSSSNTLKLKIESNGNSNSDLVYIDAVRVYASMDQLETDEITISEVEKQRTSNHEKIGENLQEAELIVMPNPVNEFLDLSSSEKLNEVKVFNLEGELILSQDMDDTKIRINTSELLPGAYILLGISDEETNSIKFVKY
ncbi:MAG TPA: T9SS type A sorting domain-containing protein, partial [Saprospiraceae bacterium]|nr:T9SS type A sorting domain-containing protein [Saprospiraceae bacterium]